MKKKLGPLPLWQWIAIGAAVGLIYYIYRARQGASAPVTTPAAAQDTTQLGAIDPTTGLPYSQEGNLLSQLLGGGAAGTGGAGGLLGSGSDSLGGTDLSSGSPLDTSNTQPTFADQLSNVGTILDLLNNLENMPGPQTETSPAAVSTSTGTKRKKKPPHKVKKPPKRKPKTRSRQNPGHIITHHPNGKKTASSSAPHNGRQHQNVAPPSHQRHPPTKHPHKAKH